MTSASAKGARRSASDEEIIREIYASMLESSRWASLFPLLKKSFATTYSVVLVRTHGGRSHVAETDDLDPGQQHAYESHYCRLRPSTCFDAARLAVGKVLTDTCYPNYCAYQRSELYNDFFRPLHAEHMAFLCLGNSPLSQRGLVLRRSRLAGPFHDSLVRRLRRVAAHLCNRESIISRVETTNFESANFRQIFDRLRVCAFIVDSACRIIYATSDGEETLCDGKLMAVQAGGLYIREARVQGDFQAAVRDCTDSLDLPGKGVSRTLRVKSPEVPGTTTISVSATTWTNPGGMARPAVLVLIGPRPQKADEAARGLACGYGLTAAESRVVAALCLGQQLTDYAHAAGLSVETVRTLVKRAMEKTDTHSQAQLVGTAFRNDRGIIKLY